MKRGVYSLCSYTTTRAHHQAARKLDRALVFSFKLYPAFARSLRNDPETDGPLRRLLHGMTEEKRKGPIFATLNRLRVSEWSMANA